MDSVTFIGTVSGVVIAVVYVIGQAGFDKDRWGGLLALVLGVVASVSAAATGAFVPPITSAFTVVLTGAITGLTASGAYSATRAMLQK